MKYLKNIAVITGLLLSCNFCVAQSGNDSDYNKFVKSYVGYINLPVELIRNCTPVNCLLRIQTDAEKNIIDLKLSDSADSLFVDEFNKNKGKLDTKSLQNYIKQTYSNSEIKTYLIPVTFGFYQMPCATPGTIKINIMYNYFKFDNVDIGSATFLNSINLSKATQR